MKGYLTVIMGHSPKLSDSWPGRGNFLCSPISVNPDKIQCKDFTSEVSLFKSENSLSGRHPEYNHLQLHQVPSSLQHPKEIETNAGI